MSDAHPAQIAPLRAGIDVDDRLHVVMIDHCRPGHRRELHQIAEHLRTCTLGPVTGVFIRSCNDVFRYCGDCIGDADS